MKLNRIKTKDKLIFSSRMISCRNKLPIMLHYYICHQKKKRA